jgi:hypothetical protein
MNDLVWLSEAQMRRIEPYFVDRRGVPTPIGITTHGFC